MELCFVCCSVVHLVGEECLDFSRCFDVCRIVFGKNKVVGFFLVLDSWTFKVVAISDLLRDSTAIVHCYFGVLFC